MSTEQTWQTVSISSDNVEETMELASQIGSRLRGGETIELASDLGGGKTAFVRGLARGAGSGDQVSSPSFTIVNEYQTKLLTIHHYDFYRLQESGIMTAEITEALVDPNAVVVIEWSSLVEDVLPKNRLIVTIVATGETNRQLSMSHPEQLAYLLRAEHDNS